MKTRWTGVLVILALWMVPAPEAAAGNIYVATTGNDGWPGTIAQPKRTITNALVAASSGDVVRVRAGTYVETTLRVPSGVRVVSHDGLYAAKVDANGGTTFRFENGCTNAEVDGFEVYSIYGGGANPTDGLVRAWNCSNIRIRNMLVHDASRDGDCIKIGGGEPTSNILVENCTVYNPAPRDIGGGWQICVDVVGESPPDTVTLRNCWLYHTAERQGDALTYAKGGARNVLWENNVFGPAYPPGDANPSTVAGGPGGDVFPGCENFVARNNLFVRCAGDAAFSLQSVRNCEFYNNVVWLYMGAGGAIEFWTAKEGNPTNENFQFKNNIVGNFNARVFWDRGYTPVPFEHDYNVYSGVSNNVSDVDIHAESHSLFVYPFLLDPGLPVHGVDTWDTIVARFKLHATSPAINAGAYLGSLVPKDILGTIRPVGGAYDIGLHEYLAGQDWYIDAAFIGTELGTLTNPFNTVLEGYTAAASSGDRLIIKAGSYPETITLSKALEVRAMEGTVVIGH
jgi:hypothetical protein